MQSMDTPTKLLKQPHGKRLDNAKRMVVIAKLFDELSAGYYSTNELAKRTGLTRKMIDTYRPLVDELIGKQKIDRNVIRHLEVKRVYSVIESLMQDLEEINQTFDKTKVKEAKRIPDFLDRKIKAKTMIYNQIAKHSSRLALITGLNIETQVNVDQHQLVIIRANNKQKPVINESPAIDMPDPITVSDSTPLDNKRQQITAKTKQ